MINNAEELAAAAQALSQSVMICYQFCTWNGRRRRRRKISKWESPWGDCIMFSKSSGSLPTMMSAVFLSVVTPWQLERRDFARFLNIEWMSECHLFYCNYDNQKGDVARFLNSEWNINLLCIVKYHVYTHRVFCLSKIYWSLITVFFSLVSGDYVACLCTISHPTITHEAC